MPERRGEYTVSLSNRPTVLSYAAVGGKKEGQGPLGKQFDAIFEDTHLGEKTWEKAESALQKEALTRALDKSGLSPSQLQYLFAGDLLNQNIASTDEKNPEPEPPVESPQTGDSGNLALWIALLFVSGGVFFGTMKKKEKEQA